jgi:hypothetical protein
MAQSAVGAIRAGCQMLSDGRQELSKLKKTVEGGVADAKAIYKEVTGIWGWLKGLLGASKQSAGSVIAKQAVASEPTKPSAKKSKREPEVELSFEEFQARAVHEICENLKIYFEAMRHLKAHCRELDELALTTDKVADSAIDRIEIQWQMNQLSAQLKQAMIYGTPESLGLGSMYKEFLAKYDEILEEQEVARELKAKRERDNRWRLEHRKEILIAKVTYAIAVAMGFLQLIGMYFTL